jgi:hypothetical protein
MNNKRSPAPDSSMQSMNDQRMCCDEQYTLPPDYAINTNRPYAKQDATPTNVDAAFNAGLVLRQKL